MRHATLTFLIFTVSNSAGAEELRLSGPKIETKLSNAFVTGTGFSQRFFAPKDNRWPAGTTYDEGGNLTFGKWEVRGNRYCSVWPPNETWSCYQMFINELNDRTILIWIDDSGRRFEGQLAD